MIRVLHIYKCYYPDSVGGIEQSIRQICANGPRAGFKSDVLSFNKHETRFYKYGNHRVYSFKSSLEISSTPFSISVLFAIRRIVKHYDIVHFHYPYPYGDFLKLLILSKPTILTYHCDIIRQKFLKYLYMPFEQLFLSSFKVIIATSVKYFETSVNLKKYNKSVTVISLGVSENLSNQELLDKEDVISSLNERYYLFVGRLSTYKGINILIKAANSIQYPLLVAGITKDDFIKKYPRQLIPNNIHFLGKVSEKAKNTLINNCEMLVLPSVNRSEAFGMVLLEASRACKPLITTEIKSGTSDINIHDVTGIVIESKNVAQLTTAIKFLFDNPEIAKQMGLNARNKFIDSYTSEKMCSELFNEYKKLIY